MDQSVLLDQSDATRNEPNIEGMGPIVLDQRVAFRVWFPMRIA